MLKVKKKQKTSHYVFSMAVKVNVGKVRIFKSVKNRKDIKYVSICFLMEGRFYMAIMMLIKNCKYLQYKWVIIN